MTTEVSVPIHTALNSAADRLDLEGREAQGRSGQRERAPPCGAASAPPCGPRRARLLPQPLRTQSQAHSESSCDRPLLSANQGVKKPAHSHSHGSAGKKPPEVPQATPAPRTQSHRAPCGSQPGPCEGQRAERAPGSLYLGSPGMARTEFWSEELEKAGKERVRAAPRRRSAPAQGPSASRSLGRGGRRLRRRRPRAKQACSPGVQLPRHPRRAAKPHSGSGWGVPAEEGFPQPSDTPVPWPSWFASPCWLGRGCALRGTKARAPRGCPPGHSFSSQTPTVGSAGWRCPAGTVIKYLRASTAQTKGPWATGLQQGPATPGVAPLFSGAAAGDPREKVPRRRPRQWKGAGGGGLEHRSFPKRRSASQSGGHGGCISGLPTWGPGYLTWGGFPGDPQLCVPDTTGSWAPCPRGEAM